MSHNPLSIDAANLLEMVITPTLTILDMCSSHAEAILLSLAASASGMNPLLGSLKKLGLYQISPEQHRNVWDNFLAYRPDLASKVRGLASQHHFLVNPDGELCTNLAYSTAIAWMLYLQSLEHCSAADHAA